MIYKYICIYILENKPAFFPQLFLPFRKQASEQTKRMFPLCVSA